MKLPALYLLLFILLFTSACNVTKHLPPGETLYAGAKVNVHGTGGKEAKGLSADLKGLVRPRPNTNILGIRYKLWFYYVGGGDSSKGIRKLIRKQFGEPPVYASMVNREKNRAVLESRLENKGYFHAEVAADTQTSRKLTTLVFDATPGPQYKIRNVSWPADSSDISKQMQAIKGRTLLKPGDPYDLETIKNERIRIDTRLKNRGYYYFTSDYILNTVDSTAGNHEVDMYMHLKPGTPQADIVPYRINNIWVYPTYTIESDSALAEAPAEPYEDFYVIDPEHKFRPKTFSRMLVFDKGELYSRAAHNRSLNRLVSMGTFKFVKARFEEVDTNGNYLDPYYFLTPLPQKSYRLEVTGLTKSNNATGTEVAVSWINRNAFRGAENLSVSVFGGAESQIYGGQAISILRYGAETNLYLPYILAPFFNIGKNTDFVPRTRFNLRYEFYSRTKQYTLNSYTGAYGFVWKTNIRNEHRLNLINLNYVQPQSIAPEFQPALDTDITLRRSVEPQFILGPSYNYNFNTNNRPNTKTHNFYFNFNVEAPGNILAVATGTGFRPEQSGLGKFLNTVYAQYFRTEIEGRHYFRFGSNRQKNPNDMIATRLLFGYGYPYGNSDQLPFVKAFFIGGVNDLRAFRARSLGPGSYYVRNYRTSGIIPDQPGDIKILASAELRKKLIAIVNGALFVDAGNIWTNREDPERPGSKFGPDWAQQIAVGAGAGIRLDLSFLVVRLDLATPIKTPFELPGATQNFDFSNRQYRRENLILNLALGYPF